MSTAKPQTALSVDERNHPDRVRGAPPPLDAFNAAGVLRAVDVHAAMTIGRLTGEDDPMVLLALALAVRAPSFGHVCADLATIRETVSTEDVGTADLEALPWPEPLEEWLAVVADSPAVGSGRPLTLEGPALYLERYGRHERRAAAALRQRLIPAAERSIVPDADIDTRLGEVFGAPPPWLSDPADAAVDQARVQEQAAVARAVVGQRLTVVVGGPGTGKTATIARLVAVLRDHTRRGDGRAARVAVAAPTGKAAARLSEELRSWGVNRGDAWLDVEPVTLARLLRTRRGTTRPGFDSGNPLPVDAVVVDEASMVGLAAMARLLDATPPRALLVLVGDPDQLASVEAGSVLGDLVASSSGIATPVVQRLHTGYRYAGDSAIARFALAVRDGDVDAALTALAEPDGAVSLVPPPTPGDWPTGGGAPPMVREAVAAQALTARAAARVGDAEAALAAMSDLRVLCAHRRGPEGVSSWNSAVEGWVLSAPPWHRPEWYAGRPVMVTANDYDLRVFNGDLGIVVAGERGLRMALPTAEGVRLLDPLRVASTETVHAMTIHKSQGSQFRRVVVVLPATPSPILTRELIYTAITRAREQVTLVGGEEVLRAAIGRRLQRTSRLPQRISADRQR